MANTSNSKKKSVKDVIAVIVKKVNKHNYKLTGKPADTQKKFGNALILLLKAISGNPFADQIENIQESLNALGIYQSLPTTPKLTKEQLAVLKSIQNTFQVLKGTYVNAARNKYTPDDKKELASLGANMCNQNVNMKSIADAKQFEMLFKELLKTYPTILSAFTLEPNWADFQSDIKNYETVKTTTTDVKNNRAGLGATTKQDITDQVNNAVNMVDTANNSSKFGGKERQKGWLNDLVDNISALYGQYASGKANNKTKNSGNDNDKDSSSSTTDKS